MFDFLKLQSTVGELSAKLKSLDQEIEIKKQERENLQTLPLPREEFADALCAKIDAKAAEYPSSLAKAVAGLIYKPFYDFENSRMDLTINYGGGAVAGIVPEANRCWFHGAEYKQRLRDAVMVMPYPEKVGLPKAERHAMIAKLDKEIIKLEQEEDKLRQQAEGAGIHLSRVDPVTPSQELFAGGRPLGASPDQARKLDRKAAARLRKSGRGKALSDMSEQEIIASGRYVRVSGGWASK